MDSSEFAKVGKEEKVKGKVKKKFSFSPPHLLFFLKKENVKLFTNMKVMSQTNCTITVFCSIWRVADPLL
jgi:hypothetical protein